MIKKTQMVRNLYLVRHGKVAFPEGIKRCIGRTELELSRAGILEAENLAEYFDEHPVEAVYTSPLSRCRKTAEILADGRYPVKVVEDLIELYMGEWENVPMKDLKKTLESEPEYGEGRQAGLVRMSGAIERILKETTGDVVCVAHAGVNCCYLSALSGLPLETSRALPQPYGGFSRIEISEDGTMVVKEIGRMPREVPTPLECEEIWNHYQTPEAVREHCRKVCEQALIIGESLKAAGCQIDLELIRSSALLHDVVRDRPRHIEAGAAALMKEGYPKVAEIIRYHHDLTVEENAEGVVYRNPDPVPNELEVTYIADKLVKGSEQVSLDERFAASREKCLKQPDAEEALKAHARRYWEAKYVERKIQNYIEMTLK